MGSLNIIIDGNYLFFKTMNITKGYDNVYSENNKYLDNQEDVNILMRKVSKDLMYSLSGFGGYRRVIFVLDSSSWRKKVDMDISDHPGYKGDRKKPNDVNMDKLYNMMDEFGEILTKYGIIVSKIDNAEGDDLLYLWSNFLRKKETPEDVVLVTGDGDITQLVDFDDETFTVVFANRSSDNVSFFVKEGFKDWLLSKNNKVINSYDMFDTNSLSEILVPPSTDIIRKALTKYPINEIDPKGVSLYKILCGDDGDSIPSSWGWVNDKGTKMRITKKHYKKIYEYFKNRDGYINIDGVIYDKKYRGILKTKLEEAAKINLPESYYSRLDLNIKLVYLDKDQIPNKIVEEFNKTKNKLLEKYNSMVVFDNIDLLEGTDYEKKVSETYSYIFKY